MGSKEFLVELGTGYINELEEGGEEWNSVGSKGDGVMVRVEVEGGCCRWSTSELWMKLGDCMWRS